MRKLLLIVAVFIVIMTFLLVRARENVTEDVQVARQYQNWDVHIDPETDIHAALPETFGENVWSAMFWPPRFDIVPAVDNPVAGGCPELIETGIQPSVVHESDAIQVFKIEEPGAGSLHSSYCAVKTERARSLVFYLVVRSHLGCENNQCGAYCGTEYDAECRRFNRQQMVDMPIIEMTRSMRTSESLE